MTTLFPYQVECSTCGNLSEQIIVGSTNTLGMPDLDTRPAEMARSTLPHWVQHCPTCGYSAPDIGQEFPGAESVIHAPEYMQLLKKRSLPEKARHFLSWAMIQKAIGEDGGAGWSALHAAWICDDAERPQGAELCRKQTLEHFLKITQGAKLLPGFEEPGSQFILIADLYRRTGQFELVEQTCRQGLALRPNDVIRQALELELDLAGRGDRDCHSLGEAVKVE